MSDAREAYERSQALRSDDEPETAGSAQAPPSGDDSSAADASHALTAPDVVDLDEPGGDAQTVVAGPPDADEVDDAMALVRAERDEYLDLLRRERAEFENFRKRAVRERTEASERGMQALATQLLGVLDDFGRVLAAASDTSDPALAKGAQLVHSQLLSVLTSVGLEQVPGTGEPFDPQWHEAMMQVPADEDLEHPVVAEVLRPGYRFKGRVIRPASVSVAQ